VWTTNIYVVARAKGQKTQKRGREKETQNRKTKDLVVDRREKKKRRRLLQKAARTIFEKKRKTKSSS
jgi:hypothetical protein